MASTPSSTKRNEGSLAPSSRGHASLLDAIERLATLSEQREDWNQPAHEAETVGSSPDPENHRINHNRVLRRGIKSLIALGVAIFLGWVPLHRLLETTSAEAAVNARLITLRAPIDGEIASLQESSPGAVVQPEDRLLRIVDQRADRSRVADLERMMSSLNAEVAGLDQRRVQLEALRKDLNGQLDAFQHGRVRQLEARIAEYSALLASAEAQRDEANLALERARTLSAAGFQSEAAFERAKREAKVSSMAVDAARERLNGARVELDGARQGLFVGDSYNDIPRSAQRVDEIRQQIVEVSAALAERQMRSASLEAALVDEEKRFVDRASAYIAAPAMGYVWEVLTAPGEQVRRGQDLMRVLDCGGTVVTAAVSESVYNSLRLGEPASFQLRGNSLNYQGRIVGLNGLAKAPANLAIEQKALVREPYHVTVEVPELGRTPGCSVGRTGKVTFENAADRWWPSLTALWP